MGFTAYINTHESLEWKRKCGMMGLTLHFTFATEDLQSISFGFSLIATTVHS